MAIIQRPDYSFQGQVPTAQIIQAYQEKALAEQKSRNEAASAKEQQMVNTAKMVQAGADMINKFTETAKLKAQEDAQKAMVSLLGQANDLKPTGSYSGVSSVAGMGEVPTAEMTEYKNTPEYRNEMISLLSKATPKTFYDEAGKKAAASLFPSTELNATAEARKTGIRDMLVTLPDGTQANKMIGFDAQGAYNPLNGSRVVSEEDYVALPERSYAMQPIEDAEGNYLMAPKSKSGKVFTGGSAVKPKDVGTVKDINLLPKKQATDANLRLKDAIEDPVIKNAKNTAVTITNVEKLLASNNKVAIDRLGGLTQKLVALDSGNLAAWEQRDPNSRAYIERLKQLWTMGSKGELTKESKAELLDLLKITKENLLQNMDDAAEQRLDALVKTYPRLNKEAMKEKLGITVYKNRLGGRPSLDSIFGGR